MPEHNNMPLCMLSIIVNFGADFKDPPVPTPQSFGSTTAGEIGHSLVCSTFFTEPFPLPTDLPIPTPTFQWFFGPNGNSSLPSGVTPSMTTSLMSNNPDGIFYTSTLQFPRLSQHLHTGMYTCRIGPGRLASNTIVTVDGRILERNCVSPCIHKKILIKKNSSQYQTLMFKSLPVDLGRWDEMATPSYVVSVELTTLILLKRTSGLR